MATTITGIMQAKVISNLDTYNHTALQNGVYTVHVQMNEIPPSGLSVVIKQNSSTIVSSSAPAATQSVIDVQALINCAINDVIGIVITSSNAQEAAPNVIKGILKITPGQV